MKPRSLRSTKRTLSRIRASALAFGLVSLLFATSSATAQDATGDWHALMDAGNFQFRFTVHVSEAEDGSYSATLDVPAQGADGVPLDEFTVENGAVTWGFARANVEYEGFVDPAFTRMNGTFTQGGQKFPLNFGREPLPAPVGSEEWARERLTKHEVYIPMRDGTQLFTSYYVPKDSTRTYPILLRRTPYNIEPGGEDRFTFGVNVSSHFVEQGYILAFQDVRGRYMSEGEFVDVRPHDPDKDEPHEIDESSDTYDTIDWLVNNVPHNNGRVGIFGVSYPGFYATMSLPGAHPALKAVSPQAPVTNWFIGDDFHHNGAFFLMDAFSFYSSFGRPRPEPTRRNLRGYQFPNQDAYEFYIDLGPIRNIEANIFGDSIKFWSEVMDHPDYDDWWKARDPLPYLTDVTPAVMVVGGWFDAEDLYGPLATYEAIETQNRGASNRILMGPWSHGQWAGGDAENLGNVHWGSNTADRYRAAELEFFNYYLKDEGELNLAEAQMFDTGALKWREFDAWPPANVEPAALYLQPGGGLAFEPPTESNSYDEYVSDPDRPVPYTEDVHLRRTTEYMTDDQRFAARRPDVMVYTSEILTEPVTLAGPIGADLRVSTTGTDADYVVKLIDVFPDSLRDYESNEKSVPMAGYQMLVRGEVLRGRYRNSFENPEPFVPGEVTRVQFEIPAVMHTFKPGHRIMIQVQNSWFPLVDRNPQKFVNIYEAGEEDFQPATHRIYHDAANSSAIRVHVLKE
jgi:putative CocE/NonD family hydrolase